MSSPALVECDILDEAKNVAQSAPLRMAKDARRLCYSELGLREVGSLPSFSIPRGRAEACILYEVWNARVITDRAWKMIFRVLVYIEA